ncbi:hypothetical protein, partial [Acinetobacter baumannii]|uniref:hypothetical protein n=1 Tax=Acinetobacter baumannii TaxID=470 RepID=UPI001C06A72D
NSDQDKHLYLANKIKYSAFCPILLGFMNEQMFLNLTAKFESNWWLSVDTPDENATPLNKKRHACFFTEIYSQSIRLRRIMTFSTRRN